MACWLSSTWCFDDCKITLCENWPSLCGGDGEEGEEMREAVRNVTDGGHSPMEVLQALPAREVGGCTRLMQLPHSMKAKRLVPTLATDM
jgi:hypothetical protein